MRLLAIDLGTSAVKAIVWSPTDGVVARASDPVPTVHRHPGWAEQDADDWWGVTERVLAQMPLDSVDAIGLSSQRETFVCLDATCLPLAPALLWSDGRGATAHGRAEWLRVHDSETFARTRWLAAPKDYVLHKMVGRLVTDTTLAARTDVDRALLPDIVEPRAVVGEYRGVPVLAGAGDRPCEAFAVHAATTAPMVSWGTTANVSTPVASTITPPAGWISSLDVSGNVLIEAGLSAAGSALGWLGSLTSLATEELTRLAAASPVGANGVVALPWFNGARAPWWRPDAHATFLGIDAGTTSGDLARAIYEGVAHDIRRALTNLPTPPQMLRLAGGGANDPVWCDVVTGVTGLPATRRHGAEAAAVGAAMLAATALGAELDVDGETGTVLDPSTGALTAYADLAQKHDELAASVIQSSS